MERFVKSDGVAERARERGGMRCGESGQRDEQRHKSLLGALFL